MLAASAALLATTLAATSAPLARADLADNDFLSSLSSAGINYSDPGSVISLGQSLCSTLEDGSQPLSSVVSSVPGIGGISPGMAGMFTSIALSMYCPQVVDSITSGNVSSLPQIPGVPGVPDLSSLAGL